MHMPRSPSRRPRPSTPQASSPAGGLAFRARAGRTAMAAAALLCAGFVAQAQAQVPPMQGDAAARYACGGIGSDESTAIRAAMKSHPLSLLFARADGAYLADVGVTIRDAKGATALRLTAGRYSVEAASEGRTQRRDVTLGGAPATADFRF
jgi:hypothetical protein